MIFVFFIISLSLIADTHKKTIAFVQDNLANDYRRAQAIESSTTFDNYKDIEFIVSDARSRASFQIYQIEDFINKKVDLLIVGASDKDALWRSLRKAKEANIPVVIMERGISSNDYTTYIFSDNFKVGQLAASFMAKKLKENSVILILEGLENIDATILRTEGFLDEIRKHGNFRIIKATANFLRRDALMEVEKLLNSGIKFDAIFSQSDSMLIGARLALAKHNIDPKTLVTVGCDYITEAKVAILEGKQDASIKYPLMGKETAKVSMDILNGNSVERQIAVPIKLITKENANHEEPIF